MSSSQRRLEGNTYADAVRARAYAELGFVGTYYLAFRDLPHILERHARGRTALDFGCGAGRSKRFLKELGYAVVGVDISEAMLAEARQRDPGGEYLLIPEGDLASIAHRRFHVVLCAFPFDNVPAETRLRIFRQLRDLLEPGGRIITVASAPELYRHDWFSFTARQFAENRTARSGDRVRVVIEHGDDQRPYDDFLWNDEDYRETFAAAELELLETHRPLGRDTDPFAWKTELTVSPWVIYVVGRARGS